MYIKGGFFTCNRPFFHLILVCWKAHRSRWSLSQTLSQTLLCIKSHLESLLNIQNSESHSREMDAAVTLHLQKLAFLISSPGNSDKVVPRAHLEKHCKYLQILPWLKTSLSNFSNTLFITIPPALQRSWHFPASYCTTWYSSVWISGPLIVSSHIHTHTRSYLAWLPIILFCSSHFSYCPMLYSFLIPGLRVIPSPTLSCGCPESCPSIWAPINRALLDYGCPPRWAPIICGTQFSTVLNTFHILQNVLTHSVLYCLPPPARI